MTKKINELLEEIDMKQIGDEIKILAREEYKEEFEKEKKERLKMQEEMRKENNKLKNEYTNVKNENGKYKKGIEQLSKMKDLNSPEAKKILNSLIIP